MLRQLLRQIVCYSSSIFSILSLLEALLLRKLLSACDPSRMSWSKRRSGRLPEVTLNRTQDGIRSRDNHRDCLGVTSPQRAGPRDRRQPRKVSYWEQLVTDVTSGRSQSDAARVRLCYVAASISFLFPMSIRPIAFLAKNTALLIRLPCCERRFHSAIPPRSWLVGKNWKLSPSSRVSVMSPCSELGMTNDSSLSRAVDTAWSVYRATRSGVDAADGRRCLLERHLHRRLKAHGAT
jgi:hypothetical protein